MKEYKTNFSAISIVMATIDMNSNEPIFPDPPHVRANDIWPDYLIDWLPKKKEKKENI